MTCCYRVDSGADDGWEQNALSVSHWEAFYREGALAACPTGPEGTYTLEARDVWVEFFALLEDGARLLDIGTGNGAITLIARETGVHTGRRLEIHGADLARIDPLRDVPDGPRLLAGITFHPGVPAEKLPFAAGWFTAVTGQFALEYTDLRASLPEIMRVLKEGGAAQFVIHHARSIVTERARGLLQQADVILTQTHLYRKLRRFIESQRAANASRPWQELSSALAAVREAGQADADRRVIEVTVDAVGKLLELRGKLAPAAMTREIDSVENSLRSHVRRLRDLMRVARDEAGMEDLAEQARVQGFTGVTYSPVFHNQVSLLGWRLRLLGPAKAP